MLALYVNMMKFEIILGFVRVFMQLWIYDASLVGIHTIYMHRTSDP